MQKFGRIVGWGHYAPPRVLTNYDLEKMVETSNEWIVTRTGIRERHIAGEGETTATMSVAAAQQALERAGMAADELDLIIVATSSPDYILPPVSSMIQDRLGARRAGAFSLVAGCTGFVYALVTAQQYIATGAYRNILVIGAELISRFLDWEDRATCVLFGDAAGAVVVRADDEPTGVLSFALGSDGSLAHALIVPGVGSATLLTEEVIRRKDHTIKMDGKAVFKFATRVLAESTVEVVSAAGLTLEEIDLIIPHQANLRIIQSAARQLGVPMEKFFINLDRYGNTSAASIPVALSEALEQGRAREGDTVVMVGFGGGLTWAAAVVQLGTMPQRRQAHGLPLPFSISIPRPSLPISVSLPVSPGRMGARMRNAADAVSSKATALLLPFFSRSEQKEDEGKTTGQGG
ncbi:MAG: ketoacyl-ACP synthase III [Chloroflexi bacterium]|nr:MAG: ketoacyl-ACP synthase III [Chloroflexota bacterium]